MSRSISDLLPEIRTNAAGCPEFLALYSLTRSLSEFLDRSEAWREWLAVRTVADIANGIATWYNHLDDDEVRWARIKRIDAMRWYPTGTPVTPRTIQQLQSIDPLWRTREGSTARHFVLEGETAAASATTVSQHRVRLYPMLSSQVADTDGVQPRVVVVTDVVADMDLSVFDDQIPVLPDRIFYAFRELITAGALARLFAMPGKDWTDQKLAGYYDGKFERGVIEAKSRADNDFSNAPVVCTYGGI